MPAQLPAGGPGAEAPREQPASPTTDDAPPPVKQEYTGAQGAEIAGSADSASAGPGASDSLARIQANLAAQLEAVNGELAEVQIGYSSEGSAGDPDPAVADTDPVGLVAQTERSAPLAGQL